MRFTELLDPLVTSHSMQHVSQPYTYNIMIETISKAIISSYVRIIICINSALPYMQDFVHMAPNIVYTDLCFPKGDNLWILYYSG